METQSKLQKKQIKTYEKVITQDGRKRDMVVTVRHDDSCGNGHNTFSISADIYTHGRRNDIGGCLHADVEKHFPELAPLIKWHLTSTDGPMHYVANTTYHASEVSIHQGKWFVYLENKQLGIGKTLLGIFTTEQVADIKGVYPPQDITLEEYMNAMAKEPDLEAARSTAIWPDAALEQLQDADALNARLPQLMNDFREAVESAGFTF